MTSLNTDTILPDFCLKSRQNQVWDTSGIDSFDECISKSYFNRYPYEISYKFNSRGFRDEEWPETIEELKNCIWCFGDSFTVGLGCPYEHIWVKKLQQYSGKRTINISMDGASNQWISRKVIDLLNEMSPKVIIVHWSYFDRIESPDKTLIDENRRIYPYSNEDYKINLHYTNLHKNLKNTLMCVKKVEKKPRNYQTRIIHSIIHDEIESYPSNIKKIINRSFSDLCRDYIPNIEKIDLARDGHHYGVKTSNKFAERLNDYIKG